MTVRYRAGLKTGSYALLVLFAGGLLAGITVRAQGNPEAAKLQNPTPASAESIASGQQLYRRYCASCHGANAEGGAGNDLIPAAPDLTDKEWKHGSSDGEIFSVIKNGVPPELNMVPFADQIKDPDIWHIVNYVKSIAKK
jgi:mono/diheme cytochrome c family protein